MSQKFSAPFRFTANIYDRTLCTGDIYQYAKKTVAVERYENYISIDKSLTTIQEIYFSYFATNQDTIGNVT